MPVKRGGVLTRLLRARALLSGQTSIELSGQATIERKRIAELRDLLRGPLTAQERDLTAKELTRLEGELVKSLATG